MPKAKIQKKILKDVDAVPVTKSYPDFLSWNVGRGTHLKFFVGQHERVPQPIIQPHGVVGDLKRFHV